MDFKSKGEENNTQKLFPDKCKNVTSFSDQISLQKLLSINALNISEKEISILFYFFNFDNNHQGLEISVI